jgi:DNA (cytosine-5)-methyltransferase 1
LSCYTQDPQSPRSYVVRGKVNSQIMMSALSVLELCAGAGGQALGFEQAGYTHVGLLEIDKDARTTLRFNRPSWNVIEGESQGDIHLFNGTEYAGVDVLAAGLPCPPWSKAGKQLGEDDERNLFPAALRIIHEVQPKAILIENVRGIKDPKFKEFRDAFAAAITGLGYHAFDWQVLNASDFGVPQLRPRAAFVAVPRAWKDFFKWPVKGSKAPTVGEALFDLMAERGWRGAKNWRKRAKSIAPTLVGGSKKHGGPDLGPTRAKREWAQLGVNAHLVAKQAPGPDFVGDPHLTVKMAARVQGFDDAWQFSGPKTSAYRQVGNAFPPPVAAALARSIARCLRKGQELNPEGGVLRPTCFSGLATDGAQSNGHVVKDTPIGEHAPNPFDGYRTRASRAADCSRDGLPVQPPS